MNALEIKNGIDTPAIHFDPVRSKFKISGRSSPADAEDFFSPMLQWVDTYSNQKPKEFILDVELLYYNTATAKHLFSLFKKLMEIQMCGAKVEVNWNYQHEDEDLREAGEEFGEMTGITFNLIGYEPED